MYATAEFTIIGRAARVDTFEYSSKGEAKEAVRMTVAVDDWRRKNNDGNTATDWPTVKMFGDGLVNKARDSKGRYIIAKGRIRTNTREIDGNTEYFTDFICEDFDWLDPKPASNEAEPSPKAKAKAKA